MDAGVETKNGGATAVIVRRDLHHELGVAAASADVAGDRVGRRARPCIRQPFDDPTSEAAYSASAGALHLASVGQSENLGILPGGFFAGLLNNSFERGNTDE